MGSTLQTVSVKLVYSLYSGADTGSGAETGPGADTRSRADTGSGADRYLTLSSQYKRSAGRNLGG